jgi:hypothetical protein
MSTNVRLTPTDLLPGDILLYRPATPTRAEQRIMAVTNSPYTHAAIFLGKGKIAESLIPDGVAVSDVVESLDGSLCVGVVRTQVGFGEVRHKKLHEFVDSVIAQGLPFHRSALIHFQQASSDFFDQQLEVIQENFGKSVSPEELAARAYFCSGFITACYEAVGIIDESAQVAYPPEFFSPAHLYEDSTFGWVLGYLMPNDALGPIPTDDPLLFATSWDDHLDIKWWR